MRSETKDMREIPASGWVSATRMLSLPIHSHPKSNKSGLLFCQEASYFLYFFMGFTKPYFGAPLSLHIFPTAIISSLLIS